MITNSTKTSKKVEIMQRKRSLSTVRVWENIGRRNYDSKTIKFNVVSYNVLAQTLIEEHPYLYTCSSPTSLEWVHRSRRLFDEIVGLAPDILCLQEVQQIHLGSFYAKFEALGYSGVFKKKTGNRSDGCAIYYKTSKFVLKEQLNVEFSQPNLQLLNRDNIGLMVKLTLRDNPVSDIVVATTHLLYNPRRYDVRLAQMRLFLTEIERFAYYITATGSGNYLPIVMTGDFNAHPETAELKLLDAGYISQHFFPDGRVYGPDWQTIGVTDKCQHLAVYLNRQSGKPTEFGDLMINNTEYKPITGAKAKNDPIDQQYIEHFTRGIISHPFDFASVYTKYKPDGSAEATTFQGNWVTVDYIYYSKGCLRVTDRLRLPTVQECADGLGRFPNSVCGSDHFSLSAVFEFTPEKQSQ